jgi:hypothetical protein
MNQAIAVYREFAPHAALQPDIRAIFSFIPEAIDALESLPIERLRGQRRATAAVNVAGLAASIEHSAGQVTVELLAHEAGIFRQQLTRLFAARRWFHPFVERAVRVQVRPPHA